MSEASTVDRPAPHVLAKVRTGSGQNWSGFADRVSEAGFKVSGRRVRAYEEGTTEKIPLEYVEAVCSAFGTFPGIFFSQAQSADATPSEAEHQLAAIREYNEANEAMKLTRIAGLSHTRPIPAAWNDKIYVHHGFEHPDYGTYVHADPDRQLDI